MVIVETASCEASLTGPVGNCQPAEDEEQSDEVLSDSD